MTYSKLSLLAAVSILGVSSLGAQTSYNFNVDQTDFNNTFVGPAVSTTNFSASWNATAGANSTGGLVTDSSQRTAYYGSTVGQFTTNGDTRFVSYYFKAGINGTTNASGNTGVGFNTANNVGLQTGTYVFANVNSTANDGTNYTASQLQISYRNNGTGAVVSDAATFALVQNNWYQLRLDLTYSGSNLFSATAALYNWGADGLTGGSQLASFASSALTGSAGGNLSTLVNTNLNAGFWGRTSNSGVRAMAIDNFSVTAIPEPSTYAAVAGLGVLALVAFRRRRVS